MEDGIKNCQSNPGRYKGRTHQTSNSGQSMQGETKKDLMFYRDILELMEETSPGSLSEMSIIRG